MKIFLLLFVLAASVLSAQEGKESTENNEPNPIAEEKVRQLNAAEVHAFLQKDSNALATIWSDDFVVTNPLNKFATKQQVLGMIDSGFLVITAYDRQIEYLHFYGGTAILAGSELVTWGGKMPNAGRQEHLRFTAVWMKQGGRWREVARHANVVPQP